MDIQYDSTEQQSQNPMQAQIGNVYIHYAGFWMRFWAYILDLIVIASINRMIIHPVLRLLDVPLADSNLFAPVSILTAITYFLYFVLMTKYLQQTLGKMVFGLKVITISKDNLTWSTVLFREFIGRFISKVTYVGFLIIAFLPKKQGIHDLFSDTTVIHEQKELVKQL